MYKNVEPNIFITKYKPSQTTFEIFNYLKYIKYIKYIFVEIVLQVRKNPKLDFVKFSMVINTM